MLKSQHMNGKTGEETNLGWPRLEKNEEQR